MPASASCAGLKHVNESESMGYVFRYIPDLTGEGTTELDVAILRGDLDTVAHKLRDRDEVDGRRGNDNLYIRSQLVYFNCGFNRV